MRRALVVLAAALAGLLTFAEVAAAKSAAYHAGYVFGRVLVIVLVVAAIIWIVRRSSRSGPRP